MDNTTSTNVRFEHAEKEIHQHHLEQLQGLNLVAPSLQLRSNKDDYNDLVKWTKANMTQINAGVAKRVFGGQNGAPLDFNNAFVAFMESAAMYLREPQYVFEAVKEFRSGNKSDAYKLLDKSTEQINTLADMWGMKFTMICDLVGEHPEGHPFMVGPYCGAFISKDSTKPFIGIAFKGTTYFNWREWIASLLALWTVHVPPEWLFGGQIAHGFFYPLFSSYPESEKPIVLIQQAISTISSKWTENAVTHVTGHSLGAAYATLCYGQFVYKGFGTANTLLGDLYTFGSPRVGHNDFASCLRAALKQPLGSAWRIVNNEDMIIRHPFKFWGFRHIDAMYKIFSHKLPEKGLSEVKGLWLSSVIGSISDHRVRSYYASLVYATTGKPPNLVETAHGSVEHFQAAALLSGELPVHSIRKQDFAKRSNARIVVDSAGPQCVSGQVKVGNLVGSITGWGDATEINVVPLTVTMHYDSLQKFWGQFDQCGVVASKKSARGLEMVFVVEQTPVGIAIVTTENDIEEANFTGTCMWDFAEAISIGEIDEEWSKTADTFFDKLFKDQDV